MLDILIRNGQVVDGSGVARCQADVAIEGDRIADIGSLGGIQARLTIDASGCVVTPGFVDMHSHSDFSLPICPTADSLIHQGITTAVVGQCGASPAPLLDETRQQVIATTGEEDQPLPWEEWSTFGDYLAYLERTGTSINVVPLVGQGMIRSAVMGFSAAPATADQIRRMQAQVVKAMSEGAIGVSTGLVYPPGSYASTEELIAVVRPAGEQDGFYFSHIRGEGDTLLEAVAEAIRIGRETGAAVQISHFKAYGPRNWDKSATALALIDEARADGLDVTTDMYPYLAGSTGLSAMLPEWAQEGGKETVMARLNDAATRARIAVDMQGGGHFRAVEWREVLISRSPRNRSYEGHTVEDLAVETGTSPCEWIMDALLETGLEASIVSFHSCEENRQREIGHPAMMIGTDGYGLATQGPLSTGLPHPRSYGTFPRVLSRYVRELGILSLEEAVWKMSGFPARKLRWTDRGLVRKGYKADLVVLDPATVTDRGTYEAPHQYPAGIHHVIVNGVPVLQEGTHKETRPGQVLRRR